MKQAAAHPISPSHDIQHPIVCWSRMQAEGGQQLQEIVFRKELERKANGGTFCWGVGNPPNRSIPTLARDGARIDVVFSVMKGRPRISDISPSVTLIWRSFIDWDGREHRLPLGSLVTSKGENLSRPKNSHFALICKSDRQLKLGDYGSFNPSAFRNVGPSGGAVGPSQVTALLRRTSDEGADGPYRINLKAKLCGNLWVKLSNPIAMDLDKQRRLALFTSNEHTATTAGWLELVKELREDELPGHPPREKQLHLL